MSNDITIPRLLLASHIKDIAEEVKKLLAVNDELAQHDLFYFVNLIDDPLLNIVGTITSLASYMKQPTDEVQA